MRVVETPLSGLLMIETQWFQDERGYFLETFQSNRYQEAGITDTFVQDNQSRSVRGVLRGMHFQVKHPQAQIVTVMRGTVYDVAVDLRPASQTFGRWFGVKLSDSIDTRQVYMAPGFAHGFCVLSDWADLHYKVSRYYDPHDEGGLLWCDEDVGIRWPLGEPCVASRDARFPRLKDLSQSLLPQSLPQEQVTNG